MMTDNPLAPQISAIETLVSLMNISPDDAQEQIAEFHELLAEAQESDDNPYDPDEGFGLMWVLLEVYRTSSGYFVDWKDRESFIGAIDSMCEERDVRVDWGTPDPYDEEFWDTTDVPKLMEFAQMELAAHGWTLWEWNTGHDAYTGFITRAAHDDQVQALAEELQIELTPGWMLTDLKHQVTFGMVKPVISTKADPDARDKNGWTALRSATHQGDLDVVRTLLAAKANPDLQDNRGWTPLVIAVSAGNKELVETLLAAKSNPDLADDNGWTPLIHAVDEGHDKIVTTLIAGGADVNASAHDGWMPLHYCVNDGEKPEQDYAEIAALLIAGGADVNARNDDGLTPLNLAAMNAKPKTLALLLSSNANADTADNNGRTPLMYATEAGNREMVEALIAAGRSNDRGSPDPKR